MSLNYKLGLAISRLTKKIVTGLGGSYLPLFFNKKWLWVPYEIWDGFVWHYEPKVAGVLRRRLKKGDSFIDIGAHDGMWSLFACHLVGEHGKVVSCEPSPAFKILQKTAKNHPEILPMNIGLGSTNGEAVFHAQGEGMNGSFIQSVTELTRAATPKVPITPTKIKIRTLDSLLEELKNQPTLIKIDVEGFELEVLKGAQSSLKSNLVTWIIEVHPPQLKQSHGTEEEIQAMLKDFGYQTEVINRDPSTLYTMVAYRE
jgi:FkbM family methyltransferase